jgi:hypothetical protein
MPSKQDEPDLIYPTKTPLVRPRCPVFMCSTHEKRDKRLQPGTRRGTSAGQDANSLAKTQVSRDKKRDRGGTRCPVWPFFRGVLSRCFVPLFDRVRPKQNRIAPPPNRLKIHRDGCAPLQIGASREFFASETPRLAADFGPLAPSRPATLRPDLAVGDSYQPPRLRAALKPAYAVEMPEVITRVIVRGSERGNSRLEPTELLQKRRGVWVTYRGMP